MTVLPPKVRPGLTGRAELVVGTNDTASRVGSGRVAVLATPVMIGVIEAAALDAVEHLLEDGKQSLGTHLDVTHVAATPVGMRLAATAELIAVEGRQLTFRVRAEDEVDVVSEGTHSRIVVDVARFDARLRRKAGKRG
ncbi:MAG TPA: thioesterase family protein [Kiloniellaceae bacterium]